MTRLLAIVAGLLAIVQVPLALSGPTALLLVPSSVALGLVVSLGATLDGLAGWPERARRWGLFFLLASLAMVGALEIGARARGSGLAYWGLPWVCALACGWIPPLVAAGAGWVGLQRGPRRFRRARDRAGRTKR